MIDIAQSIIGGFACLGLGKFLIMAGERYVLPRHEPLCFVGGVIAYGVDFSVLVMLAARGIAG